MPTPPKEPLPPRDPDPIHRYSKKVAAPLIQEAGSIVAEKIRIMATARSTVRDYHMRHPKAVVYPTRMDRIKAIGLYPGEPAAGRSIYENQEVPCQQAA